MSTQHAVNNLRTPNLGVSILVSIIDQLCGNVEKRWTIISNSRKLLNEILGDALFKH